MLTIRGLLRGYQFFTTIEKVNCKREGAMDKRAWIVFGVATVAILAGLVFFSQKEKINVSQVNAAKLISSEESQKVGSGLPDNVFGNKKSKVTLVEYGDYSCPGCAQLDKRLKPMLEEYKEDIAFTYRHFPITSIHPNSRLAAAYTEAAGMQGMYWQMHHLLFEKREEWWQIEANKRDEQLLRYATQLKLDTNKLKSDLSDPRITKKINFDLALAKSVGVKGTPALFINGKELDSKDFEDEASLRSALDKAIKQAK